MKHRGLIVLDSRFSSTKLFWPDIDLDRNSLMGFLMRPLWLCIVFLCAGLWGVLISPVLAQELVYRCGQQYTNTPRDARLCERLAPQAITVISGTRPSVPTAPAAEAVGTKKAHTLSLPEKAATDPQQARDVVARTVLSQELDKAKGQLSHLVQAYNQGEPEKWAAEARNHQKYLSRVAEMKAAIERTERDINSLQHELARRLIQAPSQTP